MGRKRTTKKHKRIKAERDFFWCHLLERSFGGRPEYAMLEQVILGHDNPARWPEDPDDMVRCEMMLAGAPAHLQVRMRRTLKRFRTHMAVGGLHCNGCDTSGHTTLRDHLCRYCISKEAEL